MLIRNATIPDGVQRDVRVEGETITAIGPTLAVDEAERVVEATDRRLFPGMIDVHVHFRQPGDAHKETWESGSRSAAAGGVTTVVDQPNTDPPTATGEAFDEKTTVARRSSIDYGINGGVTEKWNPDDLLDRPLFALGEVFLADSTGDMGIDTDLFEEALDTATDRDTAVTVHAEDASLFDPDARSRDDADAWSAFRTARAEVVAIEHACDIAQTRTSIHVAHTSTPNGIDVASEAGMTCEVTPHHLLLSRDDLDDLGTFGRMNPPLRSESLRERVYDRVADGTVEMIATDHAPHTRKEKNAPIWDAPSGVPGVETALPLLLAEAGNGRLSYERVRDLTARNPATVFDLPRKGAIREGYDADLVLVDPDEHREIRGAEMHTSVDWTPFEGWKGVFPEWTMARGTVVYHRDLDSGRETFSDHQGANVRVS